MQKYRKGTVLKTTANEPSPRPYILVERLIPFSADDAYYKAELRIVTSDTKRVSDYLKSLNIQDSFSVCTVPCWYGGYPNFGTLRSFHYSS